MIPGIFAAGAMQRRQPGTYIDEITETGVWTAPPDVTEVDLFLVGGGGGGLSGGGGGGYTQAYLGVPVDPLESYDVTIGAGGLGVVPEIGGNVASQDGGYTRFGDDDTYQAEGGKGAYNTADHIIREGGDGGSGGGASASSNQLAGDGGSDGADGGAGHRGNGGEGQGTTTRAFGDPEGQLYAGGGGAGISVGTPGVGGDGGGADGGFDEADGFDSVDGTGGGGGGAGGVRIVPANASMRGGHGGSGIALIRYTIT